MAKIAMTVVNKPYRGASVGAMVYVSAKDSRALEGIGRLAFPTDAPQFVAPVKAPAKKVAAKKPAAKKVAAKKAPAKKVAAKKTVAAKRTYNTRAMKAK